MNYGLLEQNRDGLCDALWLIGLEWDNLSIEQQSNYSKIVDAVLARNLLEREDFLTYLDESVLEHCELISSQKSFKDRLNKLRTMIM